MKRASQKERKGRAKLNSPYNFFAAKEKGGRGRKKENKESEEKSYRRVVWTKRKEQAEGDDSAKQASRKEQCRTQVSGISHNFCHENLRFPSAHDVPVHHQLSGSENAKELPTCD